MSRAYLDGVELDERGKALLLNSIGLTTYTCKSCKGAYIVLKSIFVTSSPGPIESLYWCRNCHQMSRVNEEYPAQWHQRLINRITESA